MNLKDLCWYEPDQQRWKTESLAKKIPLPKKCEL